MKNLILIVITFFLTTNLNSQEKSRIKICKYIANWYWCS